MDKPKEHVAKGKRAPKRDTRAHKIAPVRLWVRAKFVGFRRSRTTQNMNQALLQLEGVNDCKAAEYYLGKRVVYVYKGHSLKKNSKYRSIWGRITKCHGNNGVVRAHFATNMPCQAIGATIRVMLYPQHD